jgi:hypothetical protein
MNGDKIKITKKDLTTPEVEAFLEKQAALSGNAERLQKKEKKTHIFLSSWFYLMLAGFLGAFLTWCIVSPHLEDSIRVSGTIEALQENYEVPGTKKVVKLVRIGGKDLFCMEQTIYVGEDSQGEKISSFYGLKKGQYVYASCEHWHSFLFAMGLKIGPKPFPPKGEGSITAIASQKTIWSLIIFPLLGALIGLFVGCADGILSRTYMKAIKAGLLGALIGGLGGFISMIAGGIVYALSGSLTAGLDLNPFKSAPGFLIQVVRRTVAWAILGMTMGLGQGIALKSRKMVLNGFIGGTLGALLGGLLFDPIDVLVLSKGVYDPFRTADMSRLVGFCLTGLFVGFMIGLVEQISKDAWLIMTRGPITGKQFIVYKDLTQIGSSPNCEIYLFKDPNVEPVHATIKKIIDGYTISDNHTTIGVRVNDRPVKEHKLSDGDQIEVGNAEFSFYLKKRAE